MGSVIDLFPKKTIGEITVEVDPLTYWKLRNEVISESFSKYSVYQKQEILDTVLQMNIELYTLVLKLRGEIK